MNVIQLNKMRSRHNKWVFNTFLWLLSFGLLLLLFSDYPIKKIDVMYTASYIITLFFPVTISLYYLLPKYLKRERYTLFLILFFITILGFAIVNIKFHQQLVDLLFSNYFFISYYNDYQTVVVFLLFNCIVLFIKLAEDWVYFNHYEKTQFKTQLSALKSQINPHFLFNSLNVLYSLSLDKKEETTTAILQLSEILRYVIYDVNTDKVSISKEVNLIENYIAFEKNKQIENSKINFNYLVSKEETIYPMLLLPLVENAFKHGLKSGVKNPFVNISLILKNQELKFKVSNNYTPLIASKDSTYSGIGLRNVKENLAIVYPNKHQFIIEKENTIFKINLKIKL